MWSPVSPQTNRAYVATNRSLREPDGGTIGVEEYQQERAGLPGSGPPAGLNVHGQALPKHRCGKGGKPLSPVWKGRCQHCRATYDEYPPVPAP